MSEMETDEEKEKKKSVSKLGALLSRNQEMNNSQVFVYYSQNNWKTSEVVEVMVEEKTTVLQLIDSVIYKLKTEFYYDDIDENNLQLVILSNLENLNSQMIAEGIEQKIRLEKLQIMITLNAIQNQSF